uniref:Putative metal-dependent hydrolase n=1 Tax=Helianthus annuus TaxID=4232 RepID=A0A251RXK5_HELAN
MCGEDLERNSVNGSDSRESAAREISFFFPHLLSGGTTLKHDEQLPNTTHLRVMEHLFISYVTIGRSTDDTEVDIDLRKEGRAKKIFRLQLSDEIPDGDTCLSVHHPFAKQKTDKLWEALMDGDIDILSSDHSPSDLEHKLFVEGQVRKSLSAKPHADGYFISLKVEQKKPTKPENEPSKPGYTSSVAAATTFRCF